MRFAICFAVYILRSTKISYWTIKILNFFILIIKLLGSYKLLICINFHIYHIKFEQVYSFRNYKFRADLAKASLHKGKFVLPASKDRKNYFIIDESKNNPHPKPDWQINQTTTTTQPQLIEWFSIQLPVKYSGPSFNKLILCILESCFAQESEIAGERFSVMLAPIELLLPSILIKSVNMWLIALYQCHSHFIIFYTVSREKEFELLWEPRTYLTCALRGWGCYFNWPDVFKHSCKRIERSNKTLTMWDNMPEITTMQDLDRVLQNTRMWKKNILIGMTRTNKGKLNSFFSITDIEHLEVWNNFLKC